MALNREKMKTRGIHNGTMRALLIQVNNALYNRVKEESLRRNITLRKLVTRAIVNYLKSLDT